MWNTELDDWRQLADCQYVGTDWFYPERQKSGALTTTYNIARRICYGCPVIDECRETAMVEERGRKRSLRFGMRGGMTPAERHTLATVRGESDDEYDDYELEIA